MHSQTVLADTLHRLQAGFFFWKAGRGEDELPPTRHAELFSADEMEGFGAQLATSHRVTEKTGPDQLLDRLADNEVVLINCCRMFQAVALLSKVNRHITPAGEWLQDNYWLVEEQINMARRHLPASYSRELPQLLTGPSAGLPRVYDIARENIEHGDGRLDMSTLRRFVAAYQTVTPLNLGELWATPIMLRLALIENLRQVAGRVIIAWHDRNKAMEWANYLIETAGKDRKSIVMAVADMAASEPPLTGPFVAELSRRLQGQSVVLGMPLHWLESALAERGMNIEQMVLDDTRQQAEEQVSISNSMGSLRNLSAMDWRGFVEEMSIVEQVLRQDPSGIYERMDFASRDQYRHVVERLAKRYGLSEEKTANHALALAKEAAEATGMRGSDAPEERGEDEEIIPAPRPADVLADDPGQKEVEDSPPRERDVFSHVGFYLLDHGLPHLKRRLAHAEEPVAGTVDGARAERGHHGFSLVMYLGSAGLLAIFLVLPFLFALWRAGAAPWLLGLAAVPALLVSSQLTLKIANWISMLFITPRALPRLDYSKGIPPRARTLVVIPSMAGSARDVEDLLDKLEVQYLANRDASVQFGLLTDFRDAEHECMPGDDALILALERGIVALNRKYPGPGGVDAFFLCHRPRRWNKTQGMWMGYERKRGKLAEFNRLLYGEGRENYLLLAGNTLTGEQGRIPPRYVITLDTDTELPRDAARRLVETMDHPLNRPVFDREKKCVVAGHALLQPRVGVSLASASRSRYTRLFCSHAGMDPYTRTVSDVYEDVFRQGSFTGKGIYDVAAFEAALNSRFPDDRILSHDLIEGCYCRSGLVSDVLVYEDYPAGYSADVQRRRRWIRGDWQILPWLFPKVPLKDGSHEKNPLSALSRWKILDNLRRSLVAPALLSMLLLGWFVSARPLNWTLALALMVAAMPLMDSLQHAVNKQKDIPVRRHIQTMLTFFGQETMRSVLLLLVWLPFEAWYCLDSMGRTLWRLCVSKQKLLEWRPSAIAEHSSAKSLAEYGRLMAAGPVVSLLAAAGLWPLAGPFALAVAAPFLLLWAASPLIAWGMSRPLRQKPFIPKAEDTRFLRLLARKTWAFFERHAGPSNNWLPPDNVQEDPEFVTARRTSPTNMGLCLLSHLAAHDLGYLSTGRLLERLGKCLETMEGMERFRRHFYNWYDTVTLRPLEPRYISTVDSGNLAGFLLVLQQGLLEIAGAPALNPRLEEGLCDTVAALDAALRAEKMDLREWQAFLLALETARNNNGFDLERGEGTVTTLLEPAEKTKERLSRQRLQANPDALEPEPGEEDQVTLWLELLLDQLEDMRSEYAFMAGAEALPAPDGTDPGLRALADLDPETLPPEARERGLALRSRALARAGEAGRLARVASAMAEMDFVFLFDKKRGLLRIGYNVGEARMDEGCYDLLASEARLSYFTAIAQGLLPQESWFMLGRLLTVNNGNTVLLSWSGSMFEYLMPRLVMPGYEGTLLEESCRGAVACQVDYGREHGVAWGISESGYNMRDAEYNYQYRAFGVPGLGLQRGLGDDLVLAPYASALALMVLPETALANLKELVSQGLCGRYGMYEAVDHTAMRMPRGKDAVVVRSFMAHHQGMTLLSLDCLLLGQPMQRRFLADPSFQATRLLLEERMPGAAPEYLYHCRAVTRHHSDPASRDPEQRPRVIRDPSAARPEVQLLSNGTYHVMVNCSGSGYSRCGDMAVTRWREDMTRDNHGLFCYLRHAGDMDFWSVSHQPACKKADRYEAVFSDARAEFRVRRRDIDAHTEIAVSPEDNVELRRITLLNRSSVKKELELTTYGEVILAPPMADAQHPAFSNLFVETDIVEHLQAVICSRRPRSSAENRRAMFHLLSAHGADLTAVSYETDRSRFVGRGRDLDHPAAMDPILTPEGRLSGTKGAVLDPIAAIRCRLILEPGRAVVVDVVTGVGADDDESYFLMHKYRDKRLADRIFELAWTHSQVLLHQFNASLADARLYQHMASFIFYPGPGQRAESEVLTANRRGQSGLWALGVSGDNPIVLLKVSSPDAADLVTQVVKAHAYWRKKGLVTDLVVWHEEHHSYRQTLHDLIVSLIPSGAESRVMDLPGGIFVRSAARMSREDRLLLQEAARLILYDSGGTLAEQAYRRRAEARLPGVCSVDRGAGAEQTDKRGGAEKDGATSGPLQAPSRESLILANPYGGFSADGAEYVITLEQGQTLPAPWVNVLANQNVGSVVSESGSAYTWKENAHEFRLTPWLNDPVTDASGEALYLRDDESGRFWSPSALPARGEGSYMTRHGFGYSVFSHEERGIATELWVFVALKAPVKFSLLRVRNNSGRKRKLSATGYVEWVLGDLREKTAMHVVTDTDPLNGVIMARNVWAADFPGRIAFFSLDAARRSMTGDRTEFLGRNGSMANPAALARVCLSGRSGPGLDPCGAIQTSFVLQPGQALEMVFTLGATTGPEEASGLARRYGNVAAASRELGDAILYWRKTLGSIRVETPDPALDVLVNGWLMYQTISCRFLARSGYYQSGGAFGFRDQLQDAMAMIHAAPELVRAHILRAAEHQFPEGDVQHWWHPPSGRGVRTRCSDDYLWLPAAVERYIRITGDNSIMDAEARFISMRELVPGEESVYDLPARLEIPETIYGHCCRAIRKAMVSGPHGLPLMGSGDWNDGMDRVGIGGTGESVWLGFFLYWVLQAFAPLAESRNDMHFAELCRERAAALKTSLETHGWDGAWYRRAYFDDGTPLGSALSEECRIDSISQSWSVLSGAAPDHRREKAMESLYTGLVRRDLGLVQLLAPPFNRSGLEPGYIKGYVPGVRENGGQYTHAAVWAAMAFAGLSNGRRAWELLNMINPVRHAENADGVGTYKVEPYVMAADVYAVPPHEGRGGWTWYTGAAGWMYRLITESLLGLRREGEILRFTPLLPEDWDRVAVRYRYQDTGYDIVLRKALSHEQAGVILDGEEMSECSIPLRDDRLEHAVEVMVPSDARKEREASL